MSRKQCRNGEVASAGTVSGLQVCCNQPVCLLEGFTRDSNPSYSYPNTQVSFYDFPACRRDSRPVMDNLATERQRRTPGLPAGRCAPR